MKTILTYAGIAALCACGSPAETESETPAHDREVGVEHRELPADDLPEAEHSGHPTYSEPASAATFQHGEEVADHEHVSTEATEDKMVKSEEEWRAQLSPLEYHVAREAGTERAFTGRYWNTKTVGTYKCICCDTPLFRSDSKFESGCGWPSFFEPMEGAKLNEILDGSFGMSRTEVRCNNCDAHLGHVFPDGPPPTGLRYCINSVSLMLEPEKGESGQKEDSKEHDHAEGDGH